MFANLTCSDRGKGNPVGPLTPGTAQTARAYDAKLSVAKLHGMLHNRAK